MEINLKSVRISPILESIHRARITDEEYFSEKYKSFISNSRLKLINPKQGGSPETYKQGFGISSAHSLQLGSAIHCLLLQPDEFQLAPPLHKPTAKLGLVIDRIIELRKQGNKIFQSIITSCNDIDYYKNNLTKKRIREIIKAGLSYYLASKSFIKNTIFLSNNDHNLVTNCLSNLNKSAFVTSTLHPCNSLGQLIPSYNEEAFFIDFKCIHNDKEIVIKFKMKADNWTIDEDAKIITLNDLKTTSHSYSKFMDTSWKHFAYDRQFAGYLYVLLRYCEKHFNYNPQEWTVKANVIVSETRSTNGCWVYPITLDMLQEGRLEFCKLLKMVACCELYGYSDELIFI